MSNPYNWHFPQRNETMFLGTIGKKRIMKNQRKIIVKLDSLLFKGMIYLELRRNSKFLLRLTEITSPILLLSSLYPTVM